MEIWETGSSDKGAGVTMCDLVAQLEGHDSEAESGGKDNSIFRLQIYTKYKCIKYLNKKTIQVSSTRYM